MASQHFTYRCTQWFFLSQKGLGLEGSTFWLIIHDSITGTMTKKNGMR